MGAPAQDAAEYDDDQRDFAIGTDELSFKVAIFLRYLVTKSK
jgi:hypothetical protein